MGLFLAKAAELGRALRSRFFA